MDEEEAAAAMRKVHEQNKGMAAVRSKLRTWSSWLMYQGLALAAGVIGEGKGADPDRGRARVKYWTETKSMIDSGKV